MDRVAQAFHNVPREGFMPEDLKARAGIDAPLPIGFGQTISQPSTVRMMLEWLDAHPGEKILDIGSGSGWTSALLSFIVGSTGRVFAVEKIPELVEFGKQNCEKAGVTNAEFFQAGADYGLPQHSPYDRILVSASAQIIPEGLLTQLRPGGKLVIPVKNDILEITRVNDDAYETITHPGFIFVPLV